MILSASDDNTVVLGDVKMPIPHNLKTRTRKTFPKIMGRPLRTSTGFSAAFSGMYMACLLVHKEIRRILQGKV